MQVARDNNFGQHKVATLTHIWVEWLGHPGEPSGLPGHLEKPVLAQGNLEYPCDYPTECHPDSKGSYDISCLETSVFSHKPLWALA